MYWIILVFLAPVGVVSCVFAAAFWWTNLRSGHRAVIRERFGSVSWPVTKAFCTNGISMAVAFAMIPFGFLPFVNRPRIDPNSKKPPVVFVHGLVHNASAWTLYRHWFRKAGFTTQYFFTYNSMTMMVPEIVHDLSEFLGKIIEDHPGQKIALVGHSLGGLVLRAVLADKHLAAHTHALITLGAPHQGSVLANIGLNNLSRSLKYHGPLIERIEALPDPDCSRLSIHTMLDNIIVPNEGTRIRRPGWEEHTTGIVGHVDLLFYRPGAEVALGFIQKQT